ncbi:lysyl oxidase family protein [Kocuria sp. M4R2S49]|uniref:lysyl oxidase family protein n=1 Tax=Kocuria rhizosphaericola TaxID=3376284 RepID=UPI0037B19622
MLATAATAATALLLGAVTPATADHGSAPHRVAGPEDRLPDLQIEPLSDLRVQILEGRRVLRFTAVIANRGDGALELTASRTSTSTQEMPVVQRIYQRDGGYESVPTDAVVSYAVADKHSHWHLQHAAQYSLRVPGEEHPRVAHKEGFCLIDDVRLPGASAAEPAESAEYLGCEEGLTESRSVTQGISVGWGDPYSFDVWGQWIDLTGLPLPGRYCVEATADPRGLLAETDTGNNTTTTLVDLTSDDVKVVDTGC